MMMPEAGNDPQPRIAIACQGGGSHTAYTAGVLGRVLESDVDVVGLSGTSGGALCAFVAWYSLVADRRDEGPELLERLWDSIAATSLYDRAVNQATVAGADFQVPAAAEAFNPVFASWGRDRLRRAVEAAVDLDDPALERDVEDLPLLLVSAVEILTGEFTLFRNGQVGVDELLASAAVPGMYDPVELDGGLYWDGLLSQNPPVRQLAWSRPDEIWIVQIFPRTRKRAPRTPVEIRERRSELAANLSLEQEVWFVTRINELIESGALTDPDHRPIVIRRIELTEDLASSSRLDRSPAVVERLISAGERAADEMLAAHA
jgi:NTE family protein